MRKIRFIATILVFVFVFSMSTVAFAKGKIFVDLQEVPSDTPSQIINDRTMVPVRAITEMLGYDVYWINEKQQVEVCEKGSRVPVIIMNIGSTRAYYTAYDEDLKDFVGCEVELDSPAVIINSRTFVPLRFVSEAVNYVVDYNVETADVYLFSPEYMKNQEGEGIGEQPIEKGEGIGEVVPLTYEEMTYVLEQTTESWLAMTENEKSDFVVLVGRWWEDYQNIIVEDYDDMVKVLDHQMEQYHRYGVNEYVFITACDIYEVDETKFIMD